MQVFLTKNIPNLGKFGELVQVKDGYARNFLIPSGLAEEASEKNHKRWKNILRANRIQEEKLQAELEKIIAVLSQNTLKITVKTSAHGSIFGSITNIQIAKELNEQLKIQVDRRKITIPENISQIGIYEGEINFAKDNNAKFKFELVSAGGLT